MSQAMPVSLLALHKPGLRSTSRAVGVLKRREWSERKFKAATNIDNERKARKTVGLEGALVFLWKGRELSRLKSMCSENSTGKALFSFCRVVQLARGVGVVSSSTGTDESMCPGMRTSCQWGYRTRGKHGHVQESS